MSRGTTLPGKNPPLMRKMFAGSQEAPEAILPTSPEVRQVADPAAPRAAVLDEAKPERPILHCLAKYQERPVRTPTCNGIADPDRSGGVVNSDAERLARERQSWTTGLTAGLRDRLAVGKRKPRRLDPVRRYGDFRGKRVTGVLFDPFLGSPPLVLAWPQTNDLFLGALHVRHDPSRLRNGGASSRSRDG